MTKIIQTWDDGLVDDIRLTEILRRHGARATFCLNPGLYLQERSFGWFHDGREVRRLAADELCRVYEGFEICSHSMTHPCLTDISPEQLQWEVRASREALEAIFQRPVLGFCYPFNAYNDAVVLAVRAAGYLWARGNQHLEKVFPPVDPFAFHSSCHFLDPELDERYRRAGEGDGVFFFWGHSCELNDEAKWEDFERLIARLSSDPGTRWSFIADLFIQA